MDEATTSREEDTLDVYIAEEDEIEPAMGEMQGPAFGQGVHKPLQEDPEETEYVEEVRRELQDRN